MGVGAERYGLEVRGGQQLGQDPQQLPAPRGEFGEHRCGVRGAEQGFQQVLGADRQRAGHDAGLLDTRQGADDLQEDPVRVLGGAPT
ncbi:hypothetical protein ABT052_44620 [Streptomyces sp. NPDC002766]|uniref:hypothetical protein n=1 Tax=unclassified Streptomyces TaxID=2593676 RepID=UPI003328B576